MRRGEVFVRAKTANGRWVSADVLDLEQESFNAFVIEMLNRARVLPMRISSGQFEYKVKQIYTHKYEDQRELREGDPIPEGMVISFDPLRMMASANRGERLDIPRFEDIMPARFSEPVREEAVPENLFQEDVIEREVERRAQRQAERRRGTTNASVDEDEIPF